MNIITNEPANLEDIVGKRYSDNELASPSELKLLLGDDNTAVSAYYFMLALLYQCRFPLRRNYTDKSIHPWGVTKTIGKIVGQDSLKYCSAHALLHDIGDDIANRLDEAILMTGITSKLFEHVHSFERYLNLFTDYNSFIIKPAFDSLNKNRNLRWVIKNRTHVREEIEKKLEYILANPVNIEEFYQNIIQNLEMFIDGLNNASKNPDSSTGEVIKVSHLEEEVDEISDILKEYVQIIDANTDIMDEKTLKKIVGEKYQHILKIVNSEVYIPPGVKLLDYIDKDVLIPADETLCLARQSNFFRTIKKTLYYKTIGYLVQAVIDNLNDTALLDDSKYLTPIIVKGADIYDNIRTMDRDMKHMTSIYMKARCYLKLIDELIKILHEGKHDYQLLRSMGGLLYKKLQSTINKFYFESKIRDASYGNKQDLSKLAIMYDKMTDFMKGSSIHPAGSSNEPAMGSLFSNN